jgi:hypothetical protein
MENSFVVDAEGLDGAEDGFHRSLDFHTEQAWQNPYCYSYASDEQCFDRLLP